MSSTTYRKTRFVCISDTHNNSPITGAFKLPKGDVLIHAGDMTQRGSYAELRKTLDWIEQSDFEVKIVIAGNHDRTLDRAWSSKHGPNSSADACIDMFESSKVVYLDHESETIKLEREDGPNTIFKVFGSPYSPGTGLWGFGYTPDSEAAQALWDPIPSDADIVITHGPPKDHCDKNRQGVSCGCEALAQKLSRVRPKLAVCGHIHESRGADRVIWDTFSSNLEQQRHKVGHWVDPVPDGKKQCLIDLTESRRARDSGRTNNPSWLWQQRDTENISDSESSKEHDHRKFTGGSASFDVDVPENDQRQSDPQDGGIVSGSDRPRNEETCIINAAIMASSWPYKGIGHDRYNKPIVVDIDLPTWET